MDGITDSMDMNLSKLQQIVKDSVLLRTGNLACRGKTTRGQDEKAAKSEAFKETKPANNLGLGLQN